MSRVPRASTVALEHAEALSLPVEILAVDPSAGDARMRRITRRSALCERRIMRRPIFAGYRSEQQSNCTYSEGQKDATSDCRHEESRT
jgi:hypothetical protein